MIEKARVLRVEGTQVVLACDDSACGSCPASKAFCSPKVREFTATNSKGIPVSPNQLVEVFVHPGKAIWAGFTTLMLPLILFALGYVLGEQLLGTGREAAAVLVGLGGLGIGFALSYGYHQLRKGKDMPEVVGIAARTTPMPGLNPKPS
jgi:positive regulator of sigma E activity